MHQKNKLGHLQRFGPAIKHSVQGLKATYKYEIAFRQQVWLLVFLTPVAILISDSFVEFALLMLSVFGILITELLNSAVEAAVDRIGLEHHELSGRAKDIGSAAVFVAMVCFVMIWGYKLYQYFI